MSPPNAIACPACGHPTGVTETRRTINGLRRRRKCNTPTCPGRLTTLEVIMPDARRWKHKRMVLVPIDDLDDLAEALASLRGAGVP